MGSESDHPTMLEAAKVLEDFGVFHEVSVVSAHRTPVAMVEYAQSAQDRGLKVIIAGAGGAAHLPGMVASLTVLPVIGVPIQSKALSGIDSLHSIVQMPHGVPVATMAIGGAKNAGLLAVQILAISDPELTKKLEAYKESLRALVGEMNDRISTTS
jgi:5-(carboxyamino)imidazole ribonucleotide mutase